MEVCRANYSGEILSVSFLKLYWSNYFYTVVECLLFGFHSCLDYIIRKFLFIQFPASKMMSVFIRTIIEKNEGFVSDMCLLTLFFIHEKRPQYVISLLIVLIFWFQLLLALKQTKNEHLIYYMIIVEGFPVVVAAKFSIYTQVLLEGRHWKCNFEYMSRILFMYLCRRKCPHELNSRSSEPFIWTVYSFKLELAPYIGVHYNNWLQIDHFVCVPFFFPLTKFDWTPTVEHSI